MTKPKCTEGTECGYSCISGDYQCRDEIDPSVASALVQAATAADKPWSRIFAAEPIDSPMPAPPVWAMQEVGSDGAKAVKAELDRLVPQLPNTSRLSLAAGLKSWLGEGYTRMSELTYGSADDEDRDIADFDEKSRALELAVRALKLLPPVTMTSMQAGYDKQAKGQETSLSPDEDSMQQLNRWIKVDDATSFTAKYKAAAASGKLISEDGMFGTTHLDADTMSDFSSSANVQYIVKPKLDGSGGGRAVDAYKNQAYEGEVLYVPGTRFRVAGVEQDELPPVPSDPKEHVQEIVNWSNFSSEPAFYVDTDKDGFGGLYFELEDVASYANALNKYEPDTARKDYDRAMSGTDLPPTSVAYDPAQGSYTVNHAELLKYSRMPSESPVRVYLEEA